MLFGSGSIAHRTGLGHEEANLLTAIMLWNNTDNRKKTNYNSAPIIALQTLHPNIILLLQHRVLNIGFIPITKNDKTIIS